MPEINPRYDKLHSPEATDYFARADRRVLVGVRFTLELLGIPLPECLDRKPSGRPPVQRIFASKAVLAAYRTDNPDERRPARYKPLDEETSKRRAQAAIDKQKNKDAAKALQSTNHEYSGDLAAFISRAFLETTSDTPR